MSQFDETKCPECEGRKGASVFVDRQGGGRLEFMRCTYCVGLGTVSKIREAKYRLGEEMRKDRIARGMSLRQEAARLGIKPRELSNREWGRD